ncbi:MAG: hypothetical protein U0787_19100 [Polyangia bacterium]
MKRFGKRSRAVCARISNLASRSQPWECARIVQRYGRVDVRINPLPIPLSMQEMDALYELPSRVTPHLKSSGQKILARRNDQIFGHDHARLFWRL